VGQITWKIILKSVMIKQQFCKVFFFLASAKFDKWLKLKSLLKRDNVLFMLIGSSLFKGWSNETVGECEAKLFGRQFFWVDTFLHLAAIFLCKPAGCQFHQHFMCTFFANIFAPKNFKHKTQLCNFLHQNIGKKFAQKKLMKLIPACAKELHKFSPGENFINILHAHFLYKSLLSSFSLLWVWLWTNFRTKNSRVKWWWNWLLVEE